MSDILLSCLIPTIPERRTTFLPRFLTELERQTAGLPVEILTFYDNQQRSVGEKRNTLLREAKGKYIVYLDDDDEIAPDFIAEIMEVIYNEPLRHTLLPPWSLTTPL
jgi:glycosyltransferase involved in cell wall biosynthesis